MASPDVSVIIPVYNAMPYLTRCLESIIGQSLGPGRFEIIAVDDGSTDGSTEELERLAEACPAMRVFHQENSGGPSAPRNVGLDHATGRYVFFFDADDRMAPEAMERMLGLADEQDSDIVIGKAEGTGGRHSPQTMFTHNQPRADLFDSHIYRLLNVIKLFRREFLEQIGLRFREDLLTGEDQPFTAIAYLNAQVISVLADYTCFHWHLREDGGNSTVARGDLANRMVAPRTMFPLVAENVESGPQRDWLMHRHFDLDLRVELGTIPGEPSREEQLKAVREIKGWIDAYYTDAIDARMPAFHRVCFDLIRRDLFEELLAVLVFDQSDAEPATLVENGRVFVCYPFFRDPDVGVPDRCFDETARVRAVGHLDSVEWDGGLLRLRGHAHLTHVDPGSTETQLVLRERESGDELMFAEAHGPRDADDIWEAELDLRAAAERAPLQRGLWDVYARVTCQTIARDGRLGPVGLKMAGVKDRPRIIRTSSDLAEIAYSYYTEPYGNLSINVGDIGDSVGRLLDVDDVAWSAKGPAALVVRGRVHVADLPADALTLCAVGAETGAHCATCDLDPASSDGRFTGRLELGRVARGKALAPGKYSLEVRLRVANIAASDGVPRSPGLKTVRWWRSGVPYHARPTGGGDAPLGLMVSRVRLGRAITRRLGLGIAPK